MQKYINFNNDYKVLIEPAKILKNNGIVIFPTETVYGIGANAFSKEAVEKIYKIKNRDYSKPISLLVSNMEMIEQVAENINEIEYKLMKAFFPGPLTIILKKKKCIPDVVTSGIDTVGVRIPNNEIARNLIDLVGCPLATSSANISGEESGIDMQDFLETFEDKVDFLIDDGKSEIGVASTVVQVIDGFPHIIREGTITKEMIQKILM